MASRNGSRKYRSIALRVAAQFEFTIRQIDVIGEWRKVNEIKELRQRAIVSHGQVWQTALTFERIGRRELDLTTSNTSTNAIFDVTAYPLFQHALAAVPEAERRGPLVTDDEGIPLPLQHYLGSIERWRTRPECPVKCGTCSRAMAG
jgi:hypothetical protein